jgi:hypothetical protein
VYLRTAGPTSPKNKIHSAVGVLSALVQIRNDEWTLTSYDVTVVKRQLANEWTAIEPIQKSVKAVTNVQCLVRWYGIAEIHDSMWSASVGPPVADNMHEIV